MTQRELNQVYYLNKEIDMYRLKLEELESEYYKSKKITGLPISSNKTDLTGDLAIIIEEYKSLLEKCISKRTGELKKLTEYIYSIEDSLIRQILYLRHVRGMSWYDIGEELNYTKSGVFMKYKRFLKKCERIERTTVI